ncbi:isopropylmalate isomerase [Oceanicola sp. S124]|nr:isopropylmalate isomerase [Oceanicola sp. S124]
MKAADRRIWAIMTQIFDMDDRARLPWRFFGATLTILAQL